MHMWGLHACDYGLTETAPRNVCCAKPLRKSNHLASSCSHRVPGGAMSVMRRGKTERGKRPTEGLARSCGRLWEATLTAIHPLLNGGATGAVVVATT